MNKITYQPTTVPKQVWFYAGIIYLILMSIMYILIKVYDVPEYADQINLGVVLAANLIGIIFFFQLSRGHKTCYCEYDEEKITYYNRLTRKQKTFYYNDATSIIFDKKGAKFYDNNDDLVNKKKPLFMIPFFRDGKIQAIPIDKFYRFMLQREAEINDPERFKVYRTYKVLPGYSYNWKYLAFAYACMTVLVVLNWSKPLAVILGLIMTF